MVKTHFLSNVALLGLVGTMTAAPVQAQTVEEFYRGKTIDLYIGYTPGGTYDLYARLLAQHMPRHIPGNPQIIPQNMAGAGSRVAAGYIYNVAPQDGTALVTFTQSLPIEEALGDDTLQFSTAEFNWIGNPIAVNNVTVTWHESAVKTIEDAKEISAAMGATGANTSSQYPMAMNAMLGTQFDIIFGYPGGPEINLAMENGELDGRGSNDWVSWKATKPDWIEEDKLNILVQIGLEREADLPDVPLLYELAENESDQAALRMLSMPVSIGRPLVAGPGVPEDRLAALREAFNATLEDPEFLADAERQNLDINAVSGEELQEIVAEILGTSQEVKDRLAQVLGLEN